ncbi:MAG: ABC transporter permease [Acidobacteriota bacterium]
MSLAKDLRLGLRMMGRKPAFTALAVATLALGIGANTAIFSVVHSVLLRPLPYHDADRLVQVWNKYPLMNLPQATVSIPDYLDRRAGVDAFEESALYNFRSLNMASDGPPERITGVRTTASLFALLRSTTEIGQPFTPEHEEPGNDRVAILSHRLWQQRLGGDPSIVGRDIRLGGEPYRVLGVMPASFAFPRPNVQIWTPFAFTPEQRSDDARGNEFSFMLARLAPGATLEQAQLQIDAIHQANMERFPQVRDFWESSGFGGMLVPYREQLFGELEPYLLMLQAVVGFVLLIACANVANLLLTRLNARQKELALRSALGAGRWRMARQLLVESLVLALTSGFLGILLGYAGIRLLGWLGVDPGAGVTVRLDPGVLLFTLALAVITGVVFSLFPLMAVWRTDPNEVLREGGGRGGSSGPGAALPRNILVVAEMAIALLLLVGAGLMVRTMNALQQEDPGFSKERVLTARVDLPAAKYDDEADITTFYDRALAELGELPGVSSVGLISEAPFSGSSSSGSYSIIGYEPGAGESDPHGFMRVVDTSYFQTLEIPLLRGRLFNTLDTLDAERVVVIDRTLAEKYFADQDPLGQTLRRGGPDGPLFTVVGVVDTVKIRDLEQPVTKETVYFPYQQAPRPRMTFVLKTGTESAAIGKAVQSAILRLDPELPAYSVTTLDAQLRESLSTRRVSMVLLVAFGALATVLAAIGIYGVLAFSIAQRLRELGIRMALGARPGQVLQMVLRQGLTLVGMGVVIGILAALALGRLLSSMLFGVQAADPMTLAAVSLLLLTVALIACTRPAWRATRVDPIEALRSE